MVYLIVGAEIGFWVLVVAGLVARYGFGAKRTGLALLAATPAVDLLLLVAAAADLRWHGRVNIAHGVAAVYLGVSIAYGRKMISWADTLAARRAGVGPGPVKRFGAEYAAECWRDVARTLAAALIAAGLLKLLDLAAGTPLTQAGPLVQGLGGALGFVFMIDLIWAVSYTVWPKRPAQGGSGPSGEQVRQGLDRDLLVEGQVGTRRRDDGQV